MISRPTVFLLFGLALASCDGTDLIGVSDRAPAFSHVGGVMLDQQQLVADATRPLAVGGDSDQILAQVVTAGITGRLREIHLPIACGPSDLIVEIRTVDASGAPTATVLDSRTFLGGMLPASLDDPATFVSLNMGARLRLTAGSRFAVVLQSPGSCGVAAGVEDNYAGGDGFFDARPNPPGLIPLGFDLAFQTFVTATGPSTP